MKQWHRRFGWGAWAGLALVLVLHLWALSGVHAAETTGRKVALVIGNAAYAPVVALKNPVRDAELIATSLDRLGFAVTLVKDRNLQQMNQDVEDFARRAQKADLALVYYAGHGLEVDGNNYLIPVDQFPKEVSAVQLKTRGLSINYLQSVLQGANARVSVMVMDACRSLPSRGQGSQGFAEPPYVRGSLQLYSTSPGQTARDGEGEHSPFALAFNRNLLNTRLSLKELAEQTQGEVDANTQGKQRPWLVSGLVGDLRLDAGSAQPGARPNPSANPVLASARPTAGAAPSATSLRRGEGPPDQPFLRLDSGGHQGAIWALDTEPSGRWAVTAGDDKTVRVWQLPEGRLLRVIRPPLDEGLEGRLLAVALSSDGELIATGGATGLSWDGGASVYLFDRRSGVMRQRLAGLPGVVSDLAFSPDGRWLAVGTTSDRAQVLVYSLVTETPPLQLTAPLDPQTPTVTTKVTWAQDGRLALASSIGQLNTYLLELRGRQIVGVPLRVQAVSKMPSYPNTLAFSPDGRSLAVGYTRHPASAGGPAPTPGSAVVEVRDSYTLQHQLVLDTVGLVNQFPAKLAQLNLGALAPWASLDRVAWSADGRQLLGVGQWSVDGRTLARVWSRDTGQVLSNRPTGASTALAVRPLAGGRWLLGFGDGQWGRLQETGSWTALSPAPGADLRGSCCLDSLRLDPSAQAVQFGYELAGGQPLVFDLARRQLRAGTLPQGLAPSQNQLGVTRWLNDTQPTLNGQLLNLRPELPGGPRNEPSNALAELPDRSGFVLGTQLGLYRLDTNGRRLWMRALHTPAWGVNIDRSGRLLVAALGDGTVRWYRLSDGQELLALYVPPDRQRWLLWTPSGYFDAAAGADTLAGWHLNRAKDQESDFFPLQQFRERYHRPDVINQVLRTLDEDQALEVANQSAQRQEPRAPVTQALPPVLELVTGPQRLGGREVQVTLRVRSHADAPMRRLRVWVNGQALAATRWSSSDDSQGQRQLRLDLGPNDTSLRLQADNRHGSSLPLSLTLPGAAEGQEARSRSAAEATPAGEAAQRPKLWLLAVGVSTFQDAEVPALSYAHADARSFADTLLRQRGLGYRDVEARVLTNEGAGRDAILNGLQWLQSQVAEGDVGMLFLAGHGFTLGEDHRYYFGSHDVRLKQLPDTGVPYKAIQDTLLSLNLRGGGSRAVFFIDTCHAGQPALSGGLGGVRLSNGDALNSELARPDSQVLVFASSRSDQLSWEYAPGRHGAFTHALLEGLGDAWKADPYSVGQVTYKGLDAWVSTRVPALTQGRQTPRLIAPPGGLDDFALARRPKAR
ncbi:caspase family protein [Curvibacter microcysteis]|uniref:caspase family protein n=1 Tax=Curvibacter microcysteis TaxID=3026419 RepID=UPI0023620D2E|nr:caspase family protein [Curvibacter sp. HBC28]